MENKSRKNKKLRQGVVVSNSMDKTIAVLVERIIKHSVYKKTVKFSKKFQCHDPENKCELGDIVQIVECKPISKYKRWRLLDITNKN